MSFLRFFLTYLLLSLSVQAKAHKIAVLHPLLGEIVKRVGGDAVENIELMRPNQSPHHFLPNAAQIEHLGKAELCFASGLGLEANLDSLRSLLPQQTKLVVVGDTLPVVLAEQAHEHDKSSSGDLHGLYDPHWWHSIEQTMRVVGHVERELSALIPEQAAQFQRQSLHYKKELSQLNAELRKQLAQIPPQRRLLVSAHAAFGYFCKEYGFSQIAIQGANREQMPDALQLYEIFKTIKAQGVHMIFMEKMSNPKILEAVSGGMGISLGAELNADGIGEDSYAALMRGNVEKIVAGLR